MEDFDIMSFGSSIFEDGLIIFSIRSALIWLAARLIVKAIDKAVSRTLSYRGQKENDGAKYIRRIFRAVFYAVAAFIILSGIKPAAAIGKAALGATSVLAVVVSLAAQETFGNFIAGFFLAITQPFHTGDLITLPEKNISGTVTEMTFRHTVIRTAENTRVIIPNSVMNTALIEDKAFDEQNYAKWISVGVGYDTDIEKAKKVIEDVVAKQPDFIDERTEQQKKDNVPPVKIRVDELADSSVVLKFKVVAEDVGTSLDLCSDIREEILKQFAANDINIPYPTVTVNQ